jgi:hypothetical protein
VRQPVFGHICKFCIDFREALAHDAESWVTILPLSRPGGTAA